jgi:multicomponent Na+:H+ antiporter subunit G
MSPLELFSALLLAAGGLFFVAGTVGLLRFPDVHSRLHALTKADNLGLGLIAVGLCLQAESLPAAAKILAIWLIAMLASATAAYLIAGRAYGRTGR